MIFANTVNFVVFFKNQHNDGVLVRIVALAVVY